MLEKLGRREQVMGVTRLEGALPSLRLCSG